MSKKSPPRNVNAVQKPLYCKSTFTLTFAIEVLGFDGIWEDCNEGWIELDPCTNGMRIQYSLYPGQSYDLDILIWPHVAKIWCGSQYGWVRTWQLLERRWISFSIRHAFPVRVTEMKQVEATMTPLVGYASISANAKNDKNFRVLLPPLEFGERRYFAPVLEEEETIFKFATDLIWNAVVEYIPSSYLDGLFDVPHAVTDVRHQDICIENVRDTIIFSVPKVDTIDKEAAVPPPKDRNRTKTSSTKDKTKDEKPKFVLQLSGEHVIAGAGRLVRFQAIGDRPQDLGEIIVLISSNHLPAQDDYPVVFVNVDNLCEIPIDELKLLRITHLYTKWKIGDEEHSSKQQELTSKKDINFDDHHIVPLPYELVTQITSNFLDSPYEIELRGIRLPPDAQRPKLFGYEKGDHDFGRLPSPAYEKTDLDILIAVTKINAKALAKGISTIVRGEYSLYPPRVGVQTLNRESLCTNDINAIRLPVVPNLVVKPDVILLAHMTLEVCLGFVGCKPHKLTSSFSRMFCLISDSDPLTRILKFISGINEEILEVGKMDDLLTGFAIDTGDVVIFYLEGPKDAHILRVWEMTEDFYPKVKPLFSCSIRYSTRLYPEFVTATVPFNVLKMFVPLGVLLACPPVYARPTLPVPAKYAVLKLGRLVLGNLRVVPSCYDMPTSAELKSFRLELCVAPRPAHIINSPDFQRKPIVGAQSVSRINWDK